MTGTAHSDPEQSPSGFGIVMATGIVSIASVNLHLTAVSRGLFALNCVIYVSLWILTGVRIARHPAEALADLSDHERGPGYFSVVAGTAVLGVQFLEIAGVRVVGIALWWLTLVLWATLTYSVFTALTVKANKPPLAQGINGSWLLAVVATQSVAVLGALLATGLSESLRPMMSFAALSMWLWGGMLYIWLMTLIFYRYTFLQLSPQDMGPPYWINMGAMAISTLAGALLVKNVDKAPFLASLEPFLKGFMVFYWAVGTWWIPMLVILGVWRHLARRFPLRYDPKYWSAVFPLGMYSVATHEMAGAIDLPFLHVIPPVFLTAALITWALSMAGLLRSLVGRSRVRRLGG